MREITCPHCKETIELAGFYSKEELASLIEGIRKLVIPQPGKLEEFNRAMDNLASWISEADGAVLNE